ncbi:MAG: metal ABC transporter permease, partial [Bdellovibrionales bacterium]|nr:metal ABC transporter permease [Bdellovibrionales bacterium]
MTAEWSEIVKILTFQSGYNTSVVMIGVSLLGMAAGVTGVFVLLRERAMVSDAIAHSTLPGLALAFLVLHALGIERSFGWLLFGAVLSGLFGLLLIHLLSHYTRLAEEASIGAVLSVFFGAGVVLLSVIQSLGSSGSAGLSHFIYGHTASMLREDAQRLVIINATAIGISALLFKEFRLLCFDTEFARVQGWSVRLLDAVMLCLLLVVVVFGLQSVGMLLIVALLIIPATAARFWTNSLRTMLVVAGFLGTLSGYLGAAISAFFPRMPTGAVIVLSAGVFFSISFLVAPERGLLVGLYRQVAVRFRIVREHLLRSFYEEAEIQGTDLSMFEMPINAIGRAWLLLP